MSRTVDKAVEHFSQYDGEDYVTVTIIKPLTAVIPIEGGGYKSVTLQTTRYEVTPNRSLSGGPYPALPVTVSLPQTMADDWVSRGLARL